MKRKSRGEKRKTAERRESAGVEEEREMKGGESRGVEKH